MVQHPSQLPIAFDETQREQLLLEHLPQVRRIARQIHDRVPPQVLMEDLVHAGILGLMQAVKKYDPSKNVLLKHYAQFRIRGAILDSLRQVDWSPRSLRRKARQIEQAILRCKAQFGRDPTEPEIAAEFGASLENLQCLRGKLRGLELRSLEAELNEPGRRENAVQIGATREDADPYHQTLRLEMTALLTKAMGKLAQRDREVLSLYHYQELSMKEVGLAMGLGESRVSQLRTAALPRLRARVHELMQPGSTTPPVALFFVVPNKLQTRKRSEIEQCKKV
jgi:RNA polymerase sigma factor for flagellar operon FliA